MLSPGALAEILRTTTDDGLALGAEGGIIHLAGCLRLCTGRDAAVRDCMNKAEDCRHRARGARGPWPSTSLMPWLAIVLTVLVWPLVISPVIAAPKFPPLTGRVVDDAHILSAADKADIETSLKALEGKSSDQVVVYTAPSLQGYEIEDFGYQLGRAWGIGQKGTNNGILLIVAPNEHKVRIEVGRGLEPIMTDALSSAIVQNTILPGFRRGDFPGGIKAGVKDIVSVLLGDAAEVANRARSIRPQPDDAQTDWMPVIIFGIFLAIFIYQFIAQARQQQLAGPNNPNAANRRRFGDNHVIIVPGGWGGAGSWGGGGGWSSGGGGGFSGGGGDFGGGGSSGSW